MQMIEKPTDMSESEPQIIQPVAQLLHWLHYSGCKNVRAS